MLLLIFELKCSSNRPATVEWLKNIGGNYNDLGYAVEQTTDGWCIVSGLTHSYGVGEGDIYLIKTDSQGNSLWSRTLGNRGGEGVY